MASISYPFQLDGDGGLIVSEDPLELLVDEVTSILETELFSRPYRMDYGTKSYILTEIDLSGLVVDLSTKLNRNLADIGFSNIAISSNTNITDLQKGLIKVRIEYLFSSSDTEVIDYDLDYLSIYSRRAII